MKEVYNVYIRKNRRIREWDRFMVPTSHAALVKVLDYIENDSSKGALRVVRCGIGYSMVMCSKDWVEMDDE